MSSSLIEGILPFLVITGFLGLLYLCAFGFLIVACHRLHRFEKNRAWQIAWLATLTYASLVCILLLFSGISIYRVTSGAIGPGFADKALKIMSHAGTIGHLTVLICLAVALVSPLLNDKSSKKISPESQAE
jgi:hypothetical protein